MMALPSYAAVGDPAKELKEQNRTGWTILGCSQCNGKEEGADGGFAMMTDGNINTFWHSNYYNSAELGANPGHFFIVDRGEGTENSTVDGIGYIPRQANGCNGSVTGYSVYVVNSIEGIATVNNQTPTFEAADNGHAPLATFLEDKTAAATGTWDIVNNNTSTQGLHYAKFEQSATGRYVIFKINSVSSTQANQHANCAEFYLYDLVDSETEKEVNLTFKRTATDENPVVITSALADDAQWPDYPGFTCQTSSTVSGSQYVAEYVMNDGQEVRFYNERQGKYIRAKSDGSALEQVKTETPADLTVFKKIPMGDDGGFALYHPATDKFVANNDDQPYRTNPLENFTCTPQKFYTGPQDAPQTYMCWIGSSNAKKENDMKYFNDISAAGVGVGTYTWNDAGSKWVTVTNLDQFKANYALRAELQAALPKYLTSLSILEEEDTDNLQQWAEQYDFGGDVNQPVTEEAQAKIDRILNTNTRAAIKLMKLAGNKFITDMEITGDAVSTWTTAIEASTSENEARIALASLVAGRHAVLSHPQRAYMGAIDTNTIKRGAAEGKRIFTLEGAETGFRLLNEYTNKYIKIATSADVNVTAVSTAEEASVFTLEYHSTAAGTAALRIKYTGPTPFNVSDNGVNYPAVYLHSNNADTDVTNVVTWCVADNSAWNFQSAPDTDAARESLQGAVDAKPANSDALGQFGYNEEAMTAAIDAANALLDKTDATVTEMRDAAAAIRTVIASATLNMPQAGHFYRFHYGTSYLSSKVNTDNRLKIYTEEDTDALNDSTVFYYDGTYLVTFPEGLVMGNLDTNNRDKAYKGVLSTSDYAGTVTFEASTVTKGDYNIKLGNRYLYHADAQIDAGNGTDDRAGYRWNITEVTWLPIPHDGTDYFTVFSPVELGLGYQDNNRVTPYYGTIQGTTFGKYDTETTVIPANTPVLLKYVQGLINGCVYLPVNYPTDDTAAQADETTDEPAVATKVNDLKGVILATAKEEGKSYFTAQGNKFGAHEGDYIPGFSAHLAVDSESANAEGYTIGDFVTDSISEIENADDAAVTEIYDLQGRRVSKAGRGIFIVNGKKVLVK